MTPYKFLTVLSLTAALALGSSPAWCSKAPAKSETFEQEHKLLSEEPSFVSFDLLSGNSFETNLSKLEIDNIELLSDLLSTYGLIHLIQEKKIDPAKEIELTSAPTTKASLRLDPEKKIKIKELVTALLFLKSPDARLTLQKILTDHFVDAKIKVGKNGAFDLKTSKIDCSVEDLTNALSTVFFELEKMGVNPFDEEFVIGDISYHSQLKASRGEKTNIVMLIDKDTKAVLSLARIDHPKKKNARKEPGSLVINTVNNPLPAGQIIKRSSNLLSDAANNFETLKIISKGKIISTVDLKGTDKKQVVMIAPDDIFISLKKIDLQELRHNKVELLIERDEPMKLPIISGSQIGTLRIVFNGQTLKNVPLMANENVYPSVKQKVIDKLNAIID